MDVVVVQVCTAHICTTTVKRQSRSCTLGMIVMTAGCIHDSILDLIRFVEVPYLCPDPVSVPWFYLQSQTSCRCLQCRGHASRCSWWVFPPPEVPSGHRGSSERRPRQTALMTARDHTIHKHTHTHTPHSHKTQENPAKTAWILIFLNE